MSYFLSTTIFTKADNYDGLLIKFPLILVDGLDDIGEENALSNFKESADIVEVIRYIS